MYFFDTYAIVEIVHGNENYRRFGDAAIITSLFNLGELYYVLLKEFGEKKTGELMERFNFDFVEATSGNVIEAAKFRYANKKKKLSFIDCIGYILAKNKNMKFLTGDKEFENMPDVEFVK